MSVASVEKKVSKCNDSNCHHLWQLFAPEHIRKIESREVALDKWRSSLKRYK